MNKYSAPDFPQATMTKGSSKSVFIGVFFLFFISVASAQDLTCSSFTALSENDQILLATATLKAYRELWTRKLPIFLCHRPIQSILPGGFYLLDFQTIQVRYLRKSLEQSVSPQTSAGRISYKHFFQWPTGKKAGRLSEFLRTKNSQTRGEKFWGNETL